MSSETNQHNDHLLPVVAVAQIVAITEQAVLALAKQDELDLVEHENRRHVTASSLRAYIKRKQRKARRAAPKARANHEGSVYDALRGSGIWYAAISVREGRKRRRIKRRAASQQEALQKLAELKRTYLKRSSVQLAPGEIVDEQVKRPTYGELFAEWRAAIKTSVKRNTLRHYDTAIMQWLNPYLGSPA